MKKKIRLALLLVLILGAGIFFMRPKVNDGVVKLFGNVDIRQVDLSFQVPGQIKQMLFEEGNAVKKGDLIAMLDDKDYVFTHQKAQAEVKRTQAVLDEATSLLETNAPLCKADITARRKCITYTNSKNEAEAAMQAAQINADYQKNQLAYTKLYAPDDGIITVRAQEPGATVKVGQTVYTLSKNKPLWIRVYMPETLLGLVNYDTKAKVITDSVNPKTGEKQTYVGRVGYISPVAEFTPKTVQTESLRPDLVYQTHIYVETPNEFLRQGMPVTVELSL